MSTLMGKAKGALMGVGFLVILLGGLVIKTAPNQQQKVLGYYICGAGLLLLLVDGIIHAADWVRRNVRIE